MLSCVWFCNPVDYSSAGTVVKNPPANVRDMGSSPRLGRSPGEGNGNPLQYSYLENPMDRGTWFVIDFLPRNKRLLILWLQSPPAVILEPKKIKSVPVSIKQGSRHQRIDMLTHRPASMARRPNLACHLFLEIQRYWNTAIPTHLRLWLISHYSSRVR